MQLKTLAAVSVVLLAACDINSGAVEKRITPETWPQQDPVMVRDAEMEAAIQDLLARMTLEEKVGQVIQADISDVTPDDVREYNLGSVLNGGGSAPGGDNRTSADKWLALADEFWEASTDVSDGGVGIPAIWGTDAVHGHSNIVGATIFPHNIGLGMGNDPDLMEAIGRATALEIRVTGLDWTFAPTIAVVRNDRWGRTYESYSEDPAIVAAFAPRIVEGLQGKIGSDDFLTGAHMMATAKHYAGDGGTVDGIDQGNNVSSEKEFREQQAVGYPPAVAAGVQSVMASFNSFHGRKMHGHKEMLTDVLVGRMGFDGFTVGDWNGHGQVQGCTNTSCAASFNAGLDMFMAPDSWKRLYENTLAQVWSGEITMARLDEAVGRILRVKMRSGIIGGVRPSERPYAGDYELLASPPHREIARKAVRQSLIMLKNDGVLPIPPSTHVLLAGDGAHNIGKQSGGWTLNWQGTGHRREHFPNGESIYEGFLAAMPDGRVTLSDDGEYDEKPDLAVVVFGEDPYAEFQGDRLHVDYASDDGLTLLRRFRDAGIPTVAVFISGRPLWVNPELNASNAFVAAWLPGSEGGGIADVLVADNDGQPRYDFTGRLSFSWPKLATQSEVNFGDADYDPLFPFGYRRKYSEDGSLQVLAEESGLDESQLQETNEFMAYGDPVGGWRLFLRDPLGQQLVGDSRGNSGGNAVSVRPADRRVQEDTLVATWTDTGTLTIGGNTADFSRETNGDMVLELTYRVEAAGAGNISLAMGKNENERYHIDVTASINEQVGADWRTRYVKLSCFEREGLAMKSVGEPLVIESSGPLTMHIESVRIAANPGDAGCAL